MHIVKPVPSEIEVLLNENEIEKTRRLRGRIPVASGGRSTVYKINDFCLKVYTVKGIHDGKTECEALLGLQGRHVPEFYAYIPGVFVLTEWVEGLNLHEYRQIKGHVPPNLLVDMYRIELEQVRAGFKDRDFKLYENLIWLETGDVKRIDLGFCEKVGTLKEEVEKRLVDKIRKVYNNDPEAIHMHEQVLFMNGLSRAEVDSVLSNFLSHSLKLV